MEGEITVVSYPVGSNPLDSEDWPRAVFGGADLGDRRRSDRLVESVESLGRRPGCSVPQALGAPKKLKGFYRLMENEDVKESALLKAQVNATVLACGGQDRIIVVQDTTTISLNTHEAMEGLGPTNDSPGSRGLLMHSSLALDMQGIPIGLLDAYVWARQAETMGGVQHDRKGRDFEDKESFKWVRAMRVGREALEGLPADRRPKMLFVFDAEGDIHEVLQDIVESGDDAVVRQAQNRCAQGGRAQELVESAPVLGEVSVDVPRKDKKPARRARLEIRAARLRLNPNCSKGKGRKPIEINLIHAREVHPPAGVEPIEWFLWTTLPVCNIADVKLVLDIYTKRWRIERYHFTLKSGMRVERMQWQTAQRMRKALMLYTAQAVRLLRLTHLAREYPDAPCTILLDQDQWRALHIAVHKRLPTQEDEPPTLRQAVMWIARFGGHQGRKADGMPGVKTLWRGMTQLDIGTEIYRAMKAQSEGGPP